MKTCILTVIKNEHQYLDEWITYHLNLGIDHIIIIEDYGSKSHKNIIDKYNNVTLFNYLYVFNNTINIKKYYLQENYLYYGLLYIKNHYNFNWCFVIDVDEFITIDNKYKDIKEVLSLYEDYDSVVLQWQNYGANGLIYKPDYNQKGIIETYMNKVNFTLADKYGWFRNVKTVHHLDNFNKDSYNSEHVPNLKTNWCKTDFSKDKKKLIYNNMYIRHYITKSWEEYVIKLKVRGMFNRNHRNYNDFFDLNTDMLDKKEELLNMIDDIINKNKEEN